MDSHDNIFYKTAAGKTALILGPILYACSRVPKWIMDGVYNFKIQRVGAVSTVVRELPGGEAETVRGFAASYYDFCSIAFLHHMAIVFVILVIVMVVITLARPRSEPVKYPTSEIDTRVPFGMYVYGTLICIATVALFVVFR